MGEREKLFEKVEKVYQTTGHVLLEASTGSGKSLMAIKLIKKEYWLIVVPKLVLIDNWKEEFKKWGKEYLLEDQVEFCTYSGVEKYALTTEKRSVILDEVQSLNERRYLAVKDILNLRVLTKKGVGRGHVIALSATVDEERRPLLHYLGISKNNTIKFTTDNAVEAKMVADYRILIIHIPLSDKKTTHKLNKWRTFYGTETEAYSIIDGEYKKAKEKGADMTFPTLNRLHFIYNLQSKKEGAKVLLKGLNEDKRTLVFGANIAQIEDLCEYTHHSKKSKKDTTFQDFKDGKINRLGAVATIAEGVNIPNLERGIIVQNMSKSRHAIQRLGRSSRLDGKAQKQALMIILVSEGTQDTIWLKSSLNGFDYNKVKHINIEEVNSLGIEKILTTL